MRVITTPALLLSPMVVVAALLGCAPPNPENDAPFIEVVSPTGDFDSTIDETRYRVFANRPTEVVLKLIDRKTFDGDFTVTLGIDPTLAADISEIEGAQRFENVPMDENVTFLLDPGFPEGDSDLVVVANDDLGPIIDIDGVNVDQGERTARYRMTGEVVEFPVIEPAAPTTSDDLLGTLLDSVGDYHESSWTLEGAPTRTFVHAGRTLLLEAEETARGDVWVFCVARWDADSQEQRAVPREEWPAPVLEVCSEVEIGDTAPDHTEATVLPALPNATTPLYCEATANDIDGDALTFTYSWTDGTTTLPGPWLSPVETAPGDTWTCTATASDGELTETDDTSVLVRNASVVLDMNLVFGGSFTPSGATQVRIASVLGTGGGAVPGILTSDQNIVRVYPASAPTSTGGGFTLTGGPGFGGAIATGDLDADGVKDAVVSEDGAFYTLYSSSLAPGGGGAVGAIGSSFVQVGPLDDPGFGTALTIGQHRSVAGTHNIGQEDVAVTWTHPLPPNEVLLFDGVGLSRSGGGVGAGTAAVATITGGTAMFGTVLASGDFDGDGLDELVITDPGAGVGELAVVIFRGGSTLFGSLVPTNAVHRLALDTGGAGTGIGTAAVFADLDGDGLQDLVVGAPEANNSRGAIYVFRGGTLAAEATTDLLSAASGTITGILDGDRFGASLAAIRDPSGLFSDSLAVGAPGVSAGNGAVYLFEGTGVATASTAVGADFGISGGAGGIGAQLEVHDADDLDGDGFPDLVLVANSAPPRFWILGSAF